MTSKLALALIGSAAIGLASTGFASAACIDDLRTVHAEAMTGSTTTLDPNPQPDPQADSTPNPLESGEGETAVGEQVEEFDPTGNAEFDTALNDAALALQAGDEAACLAAVERARNAM